MGWGLHMLRPCTTAKTEEMENGRKLTGRVCVCVCVCVCYAGGTVRNLVPPRAHLLHPCRHRALDGFGGGAVTPIRDKLGRIHPGVGVTELVVVPVRNVCRRGLGGGGPAELVDEVRGLLDHLTCDSSSEGHGFTHRANHTRNRLPPSLFLSYPPYPTPQCAGNGCAQ